MSKRETIARYNLIINKLRRHPASFDEIMATLKAASEIHSANYVISKRTFQRDIQDINELYGIEICNDKRNNHYYINNEESTPLNERIIEAFDTFHALNFSDQVADCMAFENRRALGTEHLFGLLHAIKNCVQVCFNHRKYGSTSPKKRRVEAYLLKEFRGRWYLLGVDAGDQAIKSFALDRLSDLEITNIPFEKTRSKEVGQYYHHSFGIVGPNKSADPEQVILEFSPLQGEYIKSLPLHHSQQVLRDDKEGFQVAITIHITHDFIMELLSHGAEVKVIEPSSLKVAMQQVYKKALEQYV
jgi:predicted DNA-binding transcriptional regulator YafY